MKGHIKARIVAVAAVTALALGACGGDGGADSAQTEREKIRTLVQQYLENFKTKNASALAANFAAKCNATQSQMEAIFRRAPGQFDYELTGVQVSALTSDTAKVVAQGSITYNGQKVPINLNRGSKATVVKEDGAWKIGDCFNRQSQGA